MDELLNPAAGTPPTLLLRRLIGSYRITHAIKAAAELGITDHIGERAQSATDLAARLHAHPRALSRLLRTLVRIGLLADAGDGLFTLTPVGACLRRDAPDGMRAWALCEGAEYYQSAWMSLPRAVQTGETAFGHTHGETFYQYLARHPETGHDFSQAMLDYARLIAAAVVAGYDFARVRRVVDIGCSHGRLLSAILEANPTVSGVLFDRPEIIERAGERIRGTELAARAELVAGDFFESLPAGGDLYILSRILMDYDDDASVRLLQNCHRAMAPGGRVLIVQLLMPEHCDSSRERLFEAAVSDLNMLVLIGGRERTEGEYRTLLGRAGFRLARVVPTREAGHGRIPAGAWLLLRTDWSKRTERAAFLNVAEDGPHSPGFDPSASRLLAYERDVLGVGVETIGTDAGQAARFDPPFPNHNIMHGAGKFGLASLCNLDQLPATGAVLMAAPLKIVDGSGSPLRVLALSPA